MQLNDTILFRQQALLDGRWCDADDGATFAVTNPATGELLGTVPNMGAAETAPRHRGRRTRAWPAWRAKTAKERAASPARVVRPDAGQPGRPGDHHDRRAGQAAGRGARRDRLRAPPSSNGSPRRPSASTATPSRRRGRTSASSCCKEPIGVCAAITPWNFPAAMITRKAGAGAGRRLPDGGQAGQARRRYSALALAELAERAGVPAGVLQRRHRPVAPRSAARLTANPIVRKLTFTGSTEVGRDADGGSRAARSRSCRWSSAATRPSSSSTTPISMRRSRARMVSKYRNTGQTCVCANRICVQDGVYDAFAAQARRARGRRSRSATASRPA